MKKAILLLTLLLTIVLCAAPALANVKGSKYQRSDAPYNLFTEFQRGFSLHVGTSWDAGADTTDFTERSYVGVGLKVPVVYGAELFGTFDRNFIDAPVWQIRAGVSLSPFKEK